MYNKLFTKILDSSIWLEPMPTRIVWMTLIAAMDEQGFVAFASVPNLALRARVPLGAAEKAVTCLESPDKNSADKDHAGRRIERVPGGWIVLNAKKYRDLVTRAVLQTQTRERVARYRERKRNAEVTPDIVTFQNGNAPVTPSEAYTEAERSQRTDRAACSEPAAIAASEPIALTITTIGTGVKEWHLRASQVAEWAAVFPGVEVMAECRKAQAWLSANPAKRKTAKGMARFLVAWLSRCADRDTRGPSFTASSKGTRTIEAGHRLQAKLDAGAVLDPFGTNDFHEAQRQLAAKVGA